MFGIGVPELVLIAIVALIVVGPKKLPDALRTIGRALGEFRKVTTDLRNEVGFDDVVQEVAKPLREGMMQIEKDVRSFESSPSLYGDAEYPEEGPDDYGALPASSAVYPASPPALSAAADTASSQKPGPAMMASREIEDRVSRNDYVDDES
jgi:sec-independent protein translocase protein TatB